MLSRHKRFYLIMALVLTVTLLPTLGYSQEEPPTPDYAYIPNMGDASVSKVDLNVETPAIVAKYFTAPRAGESGAWGDLFGDSTGDLTAIAPVGWRTSRLAMDSYGNAWALNTGADAGSTVAPNVQGSVAMVLGNVSGLTYTSSGNAALPFGDDEGDEEAVMVFPIGDRGDIPRCINFSDDGHIWIGFHKASEKWGYFQEYQFDYDLFDLDEVGPRIYGSSAFVEGSEDPLPEFDIAPYNAVIDGNGTLWFVSYGSSRVNRNGGTFGSTNGVYSFDITDPIGTFTRHYESDVAGARIAPMRSGYGIIVDDSELANVKVYVTIMDTAGGAIPGLYIKTGGSDFIKVNISLSAPRGMAFGEDGLLWIANSSGGSVTRFDPAGVVPTDTFTGFGSVPVGVAMDNFGRMWVIVRDSDKLVGFDPSDPNTRTTITGFDQPYAYGEFVAPPPPRYCIEGTKLEDFYGPVIEREALEGWSIYLYNSILELGEEPGDVTDGLLASTTTDENGDYSFCGLLAGTYYVYEMYDDCYGPYLPTSGMIEVTLPAEGNEGNAVDQDFVNRRGAIRGKKVLYNGEGSVTNPSNTTLSGWDIYLFNRQLGESEIPDEALEGFLAKTTTDGLGGFIFTELCPGTYFVYEEVRDGWVQTWPLAGFYERTVTKGNVVTNNFFGNMEEEFFDIAGYKLDGDDLEKGLEGWTINLYKWDEVLEWVLFETDTTDADGKYCFEGLEAGEYKVEEEMEDGWIQLEPEDDIHLVTLPEGASDCEEETNMYNFVNAELFDLCGFKYGLDWKGFMMYEWPTDNQLEGWTIILEKYDEDEEDWVLVGTDPTDELGKYCFTGLRAGEYRLSEESDEEINGYWMMDGKYWLQVGPDEDYIYADLPDDAVECGECCEDDLTVMCPEPPHRISLDFYNLCYKNETAWMFGDTSHIGLPGLTSNNWGWSENLGIVSGEPYTIMENVPIYAAAGQNDITKGYLAGTLDIYWDGSKVIVQKVEAEDWTTLEDMKIWIGNSVLPSLKKGFTNAPGKLIIDPNIDYTKAVFVAGHFESFAPCGFH